MGPAILKVPRTMMQLRVLSVLAARNSGWATRDEIISEIYGKNEPENADTCVKVFISHLRRRAFDHGFRIEMMNRKQAGETRRQARYRLVEVSDGHAD